MVGKFLLGMVSGGLLVSGGLVVSAMLFPTSPANDNQPAAPVEQPIVATEATGPEAPAPDATAKPLAETATEAEAPAEAEAAPVEMAEADPAPDPVPEVAEVAPAAPEGDAAPTGPAPSAPSAEVAKPETGSEPSKPATAEADSTASPDVATPEGAASESPATPVAEADPVETAARPDADQLADAGTAALADPAKAPEADPEPTPEPEPVAPAGAESAPATADATEAPTTGTSGSAAGAEASTSEAAPAVTEPVSEAAAEQAPAAVAPPVEPAAEPGPVAAPTPEPASPEPATTEPPAPEPPAPEPVTEAPPAEPPAPDLPTGEAAPVVEPVPEAPTPVDPAPEETAEDPAGVMPAPTETVPTETVPGTPVPDMPGQKPEALPGVPETAEAPATTLAETEEGSTFKPAPGLIRAGEGVIIGRDAPAEAAPEDPATAPADQRPLVQFAAPFENPEARPPLAIVLVDPGTAELDRESLAALPFPVTFALDPLDPTSAQRAEIYRAGDKEVVMLVTGIAQGAQASDVEVAFQSMEQGLPQAVAAMDLADPTFQNNRLLASAVVPILKAQGRGLLTWDEGLNAADQVARRDDLEAAVVFRNLDQAGGDGVALRRLLDRSVFKADQDGRVSVVGTADPATVAALLEWTVEGKAATVALAPLSAVLSVD